MAVCPILIVGCIGDNNDNCPGRPDNGAPYLAVPNSAPKVYDGAVTRITFSTDQTPVFISEEGFSGASGTTVFTVNDFFDGLAGEGAANVHYDPDTGQGYIDFASLSDDVAISTHRITLNAGDLTQQITVTTDITNLPTWAAYPWVGTFHRWNQTGERVISSSSTGAWTAEVMTEEGDFVVLSRMPSPATIAGKLRTSDPGDAESYQIEENITSVSGNGRIFFRVGIKGGILGSATDHRYTRIKVNWLNAGVPSVSYVYVRQGDAPDYLMRPEDALTGSPNTPPRSNAVKFTCYNVTDQKLGGGPDITDHSLINGGEGVFTDYPSQAGYSFLWNLSNNATYRRAFSPSVPAPGVPIAGFTQEILSYAWDTANDVCPQGYRHASDGIWNAGNNSIFSSEFRQSLFLNPQAAFGDLDLSNSQFGYYADGWSDRQEIGVSPGATVPLGTIGVGGRIAYIGRLFFNPYTNASLFFPAGGGRAANTGTLSGDGANGIYWTTSTGGGGAAAFLSVTGRMNNQRTGSTGYARCVQE